MLQLKRTFKGSCPKHRRYDPAREGLNAIKGGCAVCHALHEVHQAAAKLDHTARHFSELAEYLQETEKRRRETGQRRKTAA